MDTDYDFADVFDDTYLNTKLEGGPLKVLVIASSGVMGTHLGEAPTGGLPCPVRGICRG